METIKEKTKVPRNTHHGHTIKRIRLDEGLTPKGIRRSGLSRATGCLHLRRTGKKRNTESESMN